MSEGRVRLRPITEADLPDYVRWLNDPEVTRFMAVEAGNCTLEGEREWFARISDPEGRDCHWAIEVEGRHMGNCAVIPDPAGQTAGFGIMIGEKTAWNKGYGTAALREVLRIGFQEMGLHRIHLEAFIGNARGIRCYEKCGFRHEGVARKARFKRGEWVDVVRMAILREEWKAAARPGEAEAGEAIIRAYRGTEYQQVIALWEAVGFNVKRRGDSREAIEYKLAHDRGPFLVAEVEWGVVGTVMASWDGRWAWAYRLAVAPEHRRKGIGRQLMAELESRLAALGAPHLHLVTGKENGMARRFYESLGYELGEDLVVMRKTLPGGTSR
jgi:RimJ/RimL family protein N-acetyltransferase